MVIPNVEVKIVDKKGRNSRPLEEGEIFVKTPYLMSGYYNHETAEPDKLLKEEWFDTGDIGKLSIDNELYITGREKDVIIRGGINISPAVIEEVLYKNTHVAECAVVGIPHKITGEEIIAVIRVLNNVDFQTVKKDLDKACKLSLPVIKQPSRIVELPEFPHTFSGKIQKNKIRAWLIHKQDVPEAKERAVTPKDLSSNDQNVKLHCSSVVGNAIEATSVKYNCSVYDMKRSGIDITVLSLGEAFFNLPLYPFSDLPFPQLYHYSHSRGIFELREALSKYFKSEYDVQFNPETEVLITAGSKMAIYMCMMSVLNPGDEVIIHEPAWVSYPEQVKLCHAVPVQVPYYETVYDLPKYISNRTKMIIINNPNNPAGKVYDLEELSFLHELAKKHYLFIMSDEAYSDFIDDKNQFISFGHLDAEKKHSIIVNSISKNLGLSGWRVGYIVTNAKMIDQILKVNQHLITCAPTVLEYYIAKHFVELIDITAPQIAQVVKNRKLVTQYLDSIGLNYLTGEATFYLFVSIKNTALSSEEFCTMLLEKYHVSAVPGVGYGKSCDNFIRVSVGAENMERIYAGLDKIKKLISETSTR
jgi:aspartate aminotransferase/aminotransferase